MPKLDFQQSSIVSVGNEETLLGSTTGGNNDLQNYDYDEGVRKYQSKIFCNLMDVVQSILPESKNVDDQSIEELKGYHQKQMQAYKMMRTQTRLRGGGAVAQNTDYYIMGGNNNYTSQNVGSNNGYQPTLRTHQSIGLSN